MAFLNLNVMGALPPFIITVFKTGDSTDRFISYNNGVVEFDHSSGLNTYTINVTKPGCSTASYNFDLNCFGGIPVPTPVPIPIPVPVPIPTPTPVPNPTLIPNCIPISNLNILGDITLNPNSDNTFLADYSGSGSTITSYLWSVSGSGNYITSSNNMNYVTMHTGSNNGSVTLTVVSCGQTFTKTVNFTINSVPVPTNPPTPVPSPVPTPVPVPQPVPVPTLQPCTLGPTLYGSPAITNITNTSLTFVFYGENVFVIRYYIIKDGSVIYTNTVSPTTSTVNITYPYINDGNYTFTIEGASCQSNTSSENFSVNSTPVPVPVPIPVPSPVPSPTPIVVPECSVLLLSFADVYAYDYASNTRTFLPTINTLPSPDIAHTSSKMWLYSNATITEYNITLNPFTMSFSRDITLGFTIGAGMCAVDNTTLITSSTSNHVYKIDISGSSPIVTLLFDLPLGRVIAGDFIKTTDGKILMTTDNGGGQRFVSQYNTSGVLEFEKEINLASPFGMFIDNNEIYINNNTDIYKLDKVNPYNLTLTKSITPTTYIEGASQIPSCCNVSITPLIPNVSLIQPNCGTSTTGKAVFTNIYNGYKWKACNASTFVCSNNCSSYDGVVSGNGFTFDSGYINGFGNQDYTIRIWSTDESCNSYKDYTFTINESLC